MGYLIVIFGFLFLGWFGARLMRMGTLCIKRRTMEVGLGYQLRGRAAVSVGTIVLLAGVLVIAPFVWGIGHLLYDVISGYLASPR